jgi:hypothetical protein
MIVVKDICNLQEYRRFGDTEPDEATSPIIQLFRYIELQLYSLAVAQSLDSSCHKFQICR